MIEQVWVCCECNAVDIPRIVAVKSYGNALSWRNADPERRYLVPFEIDHEAAEVEQVSMFDMEEA